MLQPPTKFDVKFVGDTLSVLALILVTLTFDLETPAYYCAWRMQPS